MKHIIAFLLLVFLPLVLIYIHQRKNDSYQGFKWNKFNDLGLLSCCVLFVFILFADMFAPNFVYRFEVGWSGRRTNEFSYTIYWLVALVLVTFPHVCKRSTWPLFPTARQADSMYKTKWYRLGGFVLIYIQTTKMISLSS